LSACTMPRNIATVSRDSPLEKSQDNGNSQSICSLSVIPPLGQMELVGHLADKQDKGHKPKRGQVCIQCDYCPIIIGGRSPKLGYYIICEYDERRRGLVRVNGVWLQPDNRSRKPQWTRTVTMVRGPALDRGQFACAHEAKHRRASATSS
jgi:hypothetical protein